MDQGPKRFPTSLGLKAREENRVAGAGSNSNVVGAGKLAEADCRREWRRLRVWVSVSFRERETERGGRGTSRQQKAF